MIKGFTLFFNSINSDVASGKETSDGYDSLASGGKGDGKPRKHHRKSARTRSRQEKTSKPKLSMLNVSYGVICDIIHVFFSAKLDLFYAKV